MKGIKDNPHYPTGMYPGIMVHYPLCLSFHHQLAKFNAENPLGQYLIPLYLRNPDLSKHPCTLLSGSVIEFFESEFSTPICSFHYLAAADVDAPLVE